MPRPINVERRGAALRAERRWAALGSTRQRLFGEVPVRNRAERRRAAALARQQQKRSE
jgi:hypothetical protein